MTCITFNAAEIFVQKFTLTDKILWVAGERAPLDEPPCGYRNERCSDSDTRLRDSQIAAGVLGCIFLAAVITTLFVYRKWKVEQEIAGLVWKIDPKDIISMSSQTADGFMDKSTSKVNPIPPFLFFFFLKLNHRCCCWTGVFLCCAHQRTGVYNSVYYRNSCTQSQTICFRLLYSIERLGVFGHYFFP